MKRGIVILLFSAFSCLCIFCQEYKAPVPEDFGRLIYDKARMIEYRTATQEIKQYDEYKIQELSEFFIYLHSNRLEKAFSSECSFIIEQMKRISGIEKPFFYNVLNVSLLENLRYRNTTVFFRSLKSHIAERIIESIKKIDQEYDFISGISREINIVISKRKNFNCSDYLVNELMNDEAIFKKSMQLYLNQVWGKINPESMNIIRDSLSEFILRPELGNDLEHLAFFYIKDDLMIHPENLSSPRFYSENFHNNLIFLKYLWRELKTSNPSDFSKIIANKLLFADPHLAFKQAGVSLETYLSSVRNKAIREIFSSPFLCIEIADRRFMIELDDYLRNNEAQVRENLLRVPSLSFKISLLHPEFDRLKTVRVIFDSTIRELYKLTETGCYINYLHPDFISRSDSSIQNQLKKSSSP